MALITISNKGDFSKTIRFLQKASEIRFNKILNKYGQIGVDALREATPKDTGKTAESWSYTINVGIDSATINWTNSNQNKGLYIAVLIQYGHGLKGGGYVQGYDFINPAMKPIFEDMANELWREVNR